MAFTHLDKENKPTMVDVGAKDVTQRQATARAIIQLPNMIMQHFQKGDINTKKGSVFQTAILAGIMGAKQTSNLIPLCHPLALEKVKVNIEVQNENEVVIRCTAKLSGKTGVEMEALTGATVAALTVYDMCKAFSQEIVIKEVCLIEKKGGKSDFKKNEKA